MSGKNEAKRRRSSNAGAAKKPKVSNSGNLRLSL
jgi:hypothetical protein